MDHPQVAAFTDTYLPTVNGVTYTVQTWRDNWEQSGGQMDVIYPASKHSPKSREHAVPSLPLPFYDGFRLGSPRIPGTVSGSDIVHVHTPFGLGLAGARLANRQNLPLVVSYHTPTPEYAGYLTESCGLRGVVRTIAARYEKWFLSQADHIVVPSQHTASQLSRSENSSISVISNGVDTEQFAPLPSEETKALGEQLSIPEGPVVGYTGRHGHEKNLETVIDAVAGLDGVNLVLSGDGPARTTLETRAKEKGTDAVFPGFLDRAALPAFYSLLDLFVFPSPVETEGLVAMEAIACGTPVIGVEDGALGETITDGKTGYTVPSGDTAAFRAAIRRGLETKESLSAHCLDCRSELDVSNSIKKLRRLYGRLC